jgi:hypothetical protein
VVVVVPTPAGIERFVRECLVPARLPTLPPPNVPRPPSAELERIFRTHGVVSLGPPLGPED